MNFLFTLFVTLIWMSVLVARKHRKGSKRDSDDSNADTSIIDLRGNLSKTFFVYSAQVGKNTVSSPLSALMPLGKLALGAEGLALKELLSAVGVSKKSKIRNRFKPLIVELQYLPGGKLDIASRLYVSHTAHLNRLFVDQAREIFDSSVAQLEFEYPTYAAQEINSWVSSQTNYMIREIVAPTDINPLTSLILVNAVYFSGRWKEAFDRLENKTFHCPLGRQLVPMMSRTGDYNYTSSDALNSKIIQIPYMGEKASFVIVLPNAREGLSVLLSQLKLAPELLDSAMAQMVQKRVDLSLPKFRIESHLNLRELYEAAGVKQIFESQKSGLSKITKDENLFVSSAKQNAFIEVHQYGSEAAGSSALIMAKLSNQKAETFNADHPFLFFILVKKQQIFSGTLLYPLLIYLILMSMALLATNKQPEGEEDSDVIEYADMRGNIRKTGFTFGSHIISQERPKYATSPLADMIAIGKLALGSRGETRIQLLEAIGIADKSEIAEHFQPLIKDLREYSPGVKVDIVSRLYVSNSNQLDSDFDDDATAIFNSSAVQVDFQNSTLLAEEINSWISLQTNCVINDTVENVSLKPLMLINAVYVCGKFKDTLDDVGKMDWYLRTLYIPDDIIMEPQYLVPAMGRTGIYNYTFYKNTFDIIQIPYMDEKTSLIIVTGLFYDYLHEYLGDFNWLNKAMTVMKETIIELKMPTFTIRGKSNLYERAGVKKIFEESSLEQIVKDNFLHVAYNRTKTFIKVHRFGMNPPKPFNFTGNQTAIKVNIEGPFLFVVLRNRQQLMTGYVYDPR